MATAVAPNPLIHLNLMASRRVPLSNNPNAVNSPLHSTATKRLRPSTADVKETDLEPSPPKKRQLVEITTNGTRRAQGLDHDEKDGRSCSNKQDSLTSNTFQKRLLNAQKQSPQKTLEKTLKGSADAETLRQWRRHYKKVFPNFIFFLEGLPDEARLRFSRQISTLGAKEEVFFSKAVTHVVTGKPIPSKSEESSFRDAHESKPTKTQTQAQPIQARTINPSLLEKSSTAPLSVLSHKQKAGPDAGTSRREDSRQLHRGTADTLKKAIEMDIKIWPMEKFERMMEVMFEDEMSRPADPQLTRRATGTVKLQNKQPAATELSQMIRNEKEHITQKAPWSDVVAFRGIYVYSHDVEEKTKPIIIREYPNVAQKEDGEWPQFRSVPLPRCPFIEDPHCESKVERVKEKRAQAQPQETKCQEPPRTRAAAAAIEASKPKPDQAAEIPLQEIQNEAGKRGNMKKPDCPLQTYQFEPPKLKPSLSGSIDSMPPHKFSARFNFQGLNRNAAREPTASGLQQGNVTSAIKSQMISSTAAGPGGKAGTSKEMYHLQRRAVERQGRLSVNSNSSSYMNEVRAAINSVPSNTTASRRTTRRKAVEPMTRIHEDEPGSEDETEIPMPKGITEAPKKKAAPKRDPKPGYCENCRDKYDDFYEHVESRKHKKFAFADENWKELDSLLAKLRRK